jgi:hypothetical protein
MRFDRLANRVQKVYNYKGRAPGIGPIGWKTIFYGDDGSLTSLAVFNTEEDEVNSGDAIKYRREQLGYRKPELGEYELYSKDVKALEVALLEACRTRPAHKQVDKDAVVMGCENYRIGENEYGFEYPVTLYPEAFTILAQYPLHTHLIFSVERSLGGTETPYHEGFQTFSEYLQQQLEEARTATDFTQLSETIRGAITGFRKQNAVISRIYQIDDSELMERVCLLWKEGLGGRAPEETGNFVSKAPVYNELYHLTGRIFTTPDEVAQFIANSACTAEGSGENKCSCDEAVVTRLSAENIETPIPASLKLKDPPITGDDVKAVQDALARAGFVVEGEDSTYGPNTVAAVKLFQQSKGLTADGVVGPETRSSLGL